MLEPERRRHDRVPLLTDLTVEDLCTGQSCSGRSINISRGGIGFYSAKFVPAGNDIRITIHLSRGGQSYWTQVHARVSRATIETRGTIIGALFDPELTPATQPVLCSLIDDKPGL